MGRRCGTYEAGQVLAHHVKRTIMFLLFPRRFPPPFIDVILFVVYSSEYRKHLQSLPK